MARVLLVEDDADIQALVVMRLRAAGHQVLPQPDGPSALSAVDATAERGLPDLAVLDVGLPGMDGLELLGELRTRPGLAGLPAVFLSARVAESDIARGQALGAVYLTKPFVSSALLNTVDKVLAASAPAPADW